MASRPLGVGDKPAESRQLQKDALPNTSRYTHLLDKWTCFSDPESIPEVGVRRVHEQSCLEHVPCKSPVPTSGFAGISISISTMRCSASVLLLRTKVEAIA